MAIKFILAPNPRWQGRDQTGQPIAFGKLYTYLNQTTTDKATYQDYQGLQPNTNPVELDGKGEANIYWADDDLYTIKLFTANDAEVYTQDNYPVIGTNTTQIVEESQVNICRNEQFYFWYFGTSFVPIQGNGSQSNYDFICDDWLYRREATGYTVNIRRQSFTIGQTEVPNNPKYFFEYECATTPVGETNTRLYQRYMGAETFSGQQVGVSLYAKSPTASVINVYLDQNFGTGGSPSATVSTLIGQFALTTSWAQQKASITLPTVIGKSLGTNNDDALILRIAFPNDASGTVHLSSTQFKQGTDLTDFPYTILETQFKELDNRINYGIFSTSDIKPTIKTTADPGWLMMNDQTIGNVNSGATDVGISTKALYTTIWNGVTNVYAPIYTSAGVLTTRGANAEADFNALKRLALTKTLGRVIASAGTAILATTFTAGTGSPATMTLIGPLNSSESFYNASPVQLTTTGTLPAGLSLATTYYVRNLGATTISFWPTAVDAINLTNPINVTDAGTGTHTVTINYSSFTLAQTLGERNHGTIISETPLHDHPGSELGVRDGGSGVGNFAVRSAGADFQAPLEIGEQGGSVVHNNLQPTVFLRYMIKL